MDQKTVRIFLAALVGGVAYVFCSLVVLVSTVHSYCERRSLILSFAVLGFVLTAITIRKAWTIPGNSKLAFVIPGTFFLLGTGIPTYLFLHAIKVCAAQAGR